MMKRTTVGAVMLLKDGNGQYLWRPNSQAGQPSLLLGYPVREAEDMATVGAGALPIAFGDFRAGYTIVERLGMSRSEEHTSELQSLMRISYAVFCLHKKIKHNSSSHTRS